VPLNNLATHSHYEPLVLLDNRQALRLQIQVLKSLDLSVTFNVDGVTLTVCTNACAQSFVDS